MALVVGGTTVTGTQTLDATKLTGNLPAISGASLTGVGITVADEWRLTKSFFHFKWVPKLIILLIKSYLLEIESKVFFVSGISNSFSNLCCHFYVT